MEDEFGYAHFAKEDETAHLYFIDRFDSENGIWILDFLVYDYRE